jgi:hypothetical protein
MAYTPSLRERLDSLEAQLKPSAREQVYRPSLRERLDSLESQLKPVIIGQIHQLSLRERVGAVELASPHSLPERAESRSEDSSQERYKPPKAQSPGLDSETRRCIRNATIGAGVGLVFSAAIKHFFPEFSEAHPFNLAMTGGSLLTVLDYVAGIVFPLGSVILLRDYFISNPRSNY